MKKRILDLRDQEPLLDIVSLGRAGPRSLKRSQLELVTHTVRRAPEVVIKVSGGARTLAGVEQNLRYVSRAGTLGESDIGEELRGKGFEANLIRDWNLDLEARARSAQRSIRATRKPPKLVHNLIFSMPAGTRPDLVLKAVKKLAAHQFGLRHRHAMVLHTDEPQPHVHMVVKAVSEDGERLNIRKSTLREWRREFAANLRELGVLANATERAVRGQSRTHKRDGIYRAAQRGESTYMQELTKRAAEDSKQGIKEGARDELISTRGRVVAGWHAVSERLRADGSRNLADEVDRFIARMPAPQTDKELVLEQLRVPNQMSWIIPPAKTR